MDPEELEEEMDRIVQEVLDAAGYNGPPVADMSEGELTALFELTNETLMNEIETRLGKAYGTSMSDFEGGPLSDIITDAAVEAMMLLPIGRAFRAGRIGIRAAARVIPAAGRGFGRGLSWAGRRFGILSDDALVSTGLGGMGRGAHIPSMAGQGGRLGSRTAPAAGQGTLPGMQAATVGRTAAAGPTPPADLGWVRSALAGRTPAVIQGMQNLSPNAKRLLMTTVAVTAGTNLALDVADGFVPGLSDDVPLPESGDVTMDEEGNTVTAQGRLRGTTEEIIDTAPTGNSMFNSMYWEGHTVDSANDKFMNFVKGKHIPVGVSTFQSAAANMGMEVLNIRSGPQRVHFENHILQNWEAFPRFKRSVMEKLSRRLTDYQEANHWRTVDTGGPGRSAGMATGMIRQQPMLEGPITATEPLSVEHRGVIDAMLAEGIGNIGDLEGFQTPTGPSHGAYSTMTDQFGALDEEFGAGSADQALSGIIDEAMKEYVDKYTKTNPSMLSYQDAEGNRTGFLTDFDLTEASYDGTPGGSVFSLMDLFSGPLGLKVGPAYNRAHLDNKFAQTQVNGVSSVIAEYQQAIYAMGYFVDPRSNTEMLPATWGVVDDLTATAISRLQIDIASNYARAEDLGLNPDVNKIYMQMQNVSTASLHKASAMDAPNPAEVYKASTIRQVREGIDRALMNRGVSMTSGGNDIYMDTVNEVLKSMTPGEKETAYGQGGSPEDRAGALHILDGLTDGNYTEFGAMGNGQSFINYAQRVGALSPEEMDNINRFDVHPDEVERLANERGKDVAVSNWLMFLEKPVSEASREEIRNASIMYANTVGMGTVGKAGLTVDMIRERVDHGYDSLYEAPIDAESGNLLDSLEDRVSNAMGVKDKGIGGGRYSNLLGVLNQSFTTGRA